MKIQRKQAIGENMLYFMVWAAVLLVPVLNSRMMSEAHVRFDNVLIAWRQLAPFLVLFLINDSLLAPKLLLRHKYWQYLLCDLSLVLAIFGVVSLYEEHIVTELASGGTREAVEAYRRMSFTNLEYYWNVMLGFFMTGANAGIKLLYESIRNEQAMADLKRQNMEAEMDYLKYQINPHFFMNTLNNIHALIDIDTESAKRAVIELSKMMRYVLYESGLERVSVERDIQFLRNYIELMRIRYSDRVEIRIDTPAQWPPRITIPPLLLIVFAENAFKHGVSYQTDCYIHIDIRLRDGMLVSTFVNSRPPQNDKEPGKAGIGLENVRKRLALLYGDGNYTLDIRQRPDTYTVNLEIPAPHA